MTSKKLFCPSNPTRVLDALWTFLDGRDISNDIIFLPSRRAIRALEKMIANRLGGAAVLPKLVPLGDAPDGIIFDNVISNTERAIVAAQLISVAQNISISNALPIANDLISLQDYLENEGIESKPDWENLVGEKYANHWAARASFLNIVDNVMPQIFPGKITSSKARNLGILSWADICKNCKGRVIICGSTGSVYATRQLMKTVSELENGIIIFPGKVESINEINECNPYYNIHNFLNGKDVDIIDVGDSDIDFFNSAFSNNTNKIKTNMPNLNWYDLETESDEANMVAKIASDAINQNKSVLIITPDAAGNQRLKESLYAHNLTADFSGGESGETALISRQILNSFDDTTHKNILDIASEFEFDESDSEIAIALNELNEILIRNGITPDISDLRALTRNVLSQISLRPTLNEDAKIRVLGTMESRMMTADVVILTGLNDGMFPGIGYENNWIPRHIADDIGLPSPSRKVSLMGMDFITLSCAGTVYYTRAKNSGGVKTMPSRFLSRLKIMGLNPEIITQNPELRTLNSEPQPPTPVADFSDVFVTSLDLLIHNPFAFYARHILGLRPKNDWWHEFDARDFGILVHGVIQDCAQNKTYDPDFIVKILDERAKDLLPKDTVNFYFWHKRFIEFAPVISELLKTSDVPNRKIESEICVKIGARNVRARADMIYNNTVLDIKTGGTPSKKSLLLGNAPQLPLEAFMTSADTIQFLQLKNNDVKLITYDNTDAEIMIKNTVQKISELFGMYGNDFTTYEYRKTTEPKYHMWDDYYRYKS